jgi:hypothetical protein
MSELIYEKLSDLWISGSIIGIMGALRLDALNLRSKNSRVKECSKIKK